MNRFQVVVSSVVGCGTLSISILSFLYTRAKMTDKYLQEYSDDSFRIALRDLQTFAMRYPNTFPQEYDQLFALRRENIHNSKREELEAIDKARRTIFNFANRVAYARRFGLLLSEKNSDLFGYSFHHTLHNIIQKITTPADVERHGRIFDEACNQLSNANQHPPQKHTDESPPQNRKEEHKY